MNPLSARFVLSPIVFTAFSAADLHKKITSFLFSLSCLAILALQIVKPISTTG